jgi:hypothetical protein
MPTLPEQPARIGSPVPYLGSPHLRPPHPAHHSTVNGCDPARVRRLCRRVKRPVALRPASLPCEVTAACAARFARTCCALSWENPGAGAQRSFAIVRALWATVTAPSAPPRSPPSRKRSEPSRRASRSGEPVGLGNPAGDRHRPNRHDSHTYEGRGVTTPDCHRAKRPSGRTLTEFPTGARLFQAPMPTLSRLLSPRPEPGGSARPALATGRTPGLE